MLAIEFGHFTSLQLIPRVRHPIQSLGSAARTRRAWGDAIDRCAVQSAGALLGEHWVIAALGLTGLFLLSLSRALRAFRERE